MSDSAPDPPDPSSLPQDSSVAADSVVPSLMQVYNTMCQSKTPEGGPRHVAGAASFTTGFGGASTYTAAAGAAQGGGISSANVADWNAYAASTTAGGTSLPAIPAIPARGFKEEYNATDERPVAATPSANPRNLRRKRSSTTSLKDDSPTPSVSSGRGSKARRKAKDTDSRWSKRFSWPEDLHRDFVAAIFDVGLKHSSPSTILEHMPKHEQITSERVKSHLQKYRLHRIKSKREFMASYDAGMKKIGEGTHVMGSLSAGEVASMLTHGSLHENNPTEQQQQQPSSNLSASGPATVETEDQNSSDAKTGNPQDVLTLPRLTEAEKQSPIGASMGYLLGLFFSLKQQLMAQRAAVQAADADAKKTDAAGTPAAAVYDSFVSGPGGVASTATPSDTITPAPQAATVVSNPSTRSNLEENNMMKREMQNQMAFQNKMRGLKQQELNKFRHTEGEKEAVLSMASPTAPGATLPMSPEKGLTDPSQQGAGEVVVDGQRRGHGLSIGNAEEFWNTDVMDEQLFEFLMSEG